MVCMCFDKALFSKEIQVSAIQAIWVSPLPQLWGFVIAYALALTQVNEAWAPLRVSVADSRGMWKDRESLSLLAMHTCLPGPGWSP